MPAPDFRLYHGNDLELLAGLLAEELARPLPGRPLLEPDTILVPQPAVRRWLQKTLAERHGVAANLRFLAPGEFVRQLLDANVPAAGAVAGDAAVLRWRLWRELSDPERLRAPAFAPLVPALAAADPSLAAWQLAGALAQAFDKYQAWRRDWLLRWDKGADKDDWQAELWRRATRGVAHRARRLETYFARLGDAGVPAGVPARVFAFACQNVSPDVLRALASAGRAGPVHFYFVSPVRGWWGDLRTVRERLQADEAFDDGEHPLLRANGAAGRDFVRTLFGYEVVHPAYEQAVYVGPDPGTRTGLLHRIQRDLLERAAPRSAGLDAEAMADATLQVHACHTRLREVQVLHDRIRDLLEADPSLQPREIAVLAPDLAPYAPLVDAVFGAAQGRASAAAGTARPGLDPGMPEAAASIPYTLADGLSLAMRPAARLFAQLLELPRSPFGAEEILDLLAHPLLAERFDLAPRDFDHLRQWLGAAGARWGLDGAHRAALGAPDDPAYTWSWALDRLLLGHASGDDASIAGVAPLPVLDGGDLAVLDRALHGLRRLAHWQRALATPRPAAQWTQQLDALLDDLFPAHPREADDRAVLELLRARLAALGTEAAQAGMDAPVAASVVRAWCADALADDAARAPLLTGGVTFARMVPMRWVPFKVICLLGMDDDAFPRREAPGGLNRLAGAGERRVGDPSVRDDDRGLFLQLLGAATQALHVSYVGQDPRTHEPRPPSVCVAELLDVAAAYFADPADARARLTVVHPLQPFAAAAFGGGAEPDPRRRGYRADWHAAAVAATGPRAAAPPFATPLPPREDPAPRGDWTLPQLLRALANPAREFLEARLGVDLAQRDDRLDEAEPFAADDGLARWQRVSRALALCLADPHLDADALARRLLAEGHAPPGPAGRAAAHATLEALAPALAAWRHDPATQVREFALDLGEDRVLRGRLARVHRDGLRQFSASRAHGKTVLALGLEALAWSALGERAPIDRVVAGERTTLAPLDAAVARAKLRALVDLAQRARDEALPFAPKTGLELVRHADPDAKAVREAWKGDDAGGRPGEADDPWIRVALRGAMPLDDAAATARLAELARHVFDDLPGVDRAPDADAEDAA